MRDGIRLYWDRDETAIAATAKKYGNYCGSIALNILKDREDAEECVNEMGKVTCEKEIYDRVVNTYGFPSELFEVMDERKRDEIAGLLYAMPEISADERLIAVMEVLEERGITTETLAAIFLFSALHLTGYLALPPSPFAPDLFAWF